MLLRGQEKALHENISSGKNRQTDRQRTPWLGLALLGDAIRQVRPESLGHPVRSVLSHYSCLPWQQPDFFMSCLRLVGSTSLLPAGGCAGSDAFCTDSRGSHRRIRLRVRLMCPLIFCYRLCSQRLRPNSSCHAAKAALSHYHMQSEKMLTSCQQCYFLSFASLPS